MRSSRRRAGGEARFTLAKHPRSAAKGAGLVHSGLRPTGGFALQQLADLHAARVGDDVGAAEVIQEQVVGLPAGAHSDASA